MKTYRSIFVSDIYNRKVVCLEWRKKEKKKGHQGGNIPPRIDGTPNGNLLKADSGSQSLKEFTIWRISHHCHLCDPLQCLEMSQ